MKHDLRKTLVPAEALAPFLKGLYGRVANGIGIDVSSVIEVARGECRSKAVEDALRRELEAVVSRARRARAA